MKLIKGLLLGSAAVTLAACGSNEAPGGEEETVTIEYWHPNADTQGGQTITQLTDEFNESQDEIEVVPVFNEGMYQGLMQNLQTQIAGGEVPALVQIGWSYREYFSNNFSYTDPQAILDEHFPEETAYLSEKFEDNILNLAVNNGGELVGTPYSLSVPVIYVNNDILEEAGVAAEDLTSWEAVREAANTITETTDYHGLYIAEHADNWNVQSMIESNGGQVISDEQAAFADENGIETYQFYQDMINEGSALHVPNDQGQQAFISGEVGMAHMTIAQRTNVMSNSTFDAAAVPSPAFEGEEANLPAGGSMLVVTADESEQQRAALEFMQFLYEPDNVAAWTEGTGYVPETMDATENEELNDLLNNDPIFSAANSSLDLITEWAPFPGNSGLQAEQMLIDLRDRVLNGADVKESVTETAEEINQLIK